MTYMLLLNCALKLVEKNAFIFPMKNISEVLLRELRYAVLAQPSNNFVYYTRLRNTSKLGFPRKSSNPLS